MCMCVFLCICMCASRYVYTKLPNDAKRFLSPICLIYINNAVCHNVTDNAQSYCDYIETEIM